MPRDIEVSIHRAKAQGWATCATSVDVFLKAVSTSGATIVPTRRGDHPVGILRARNSQNAHPRSLSSRYGLGELPPHTDGAHHVRPPDLVVLQATRVSQRPTTLWRLPRFKLTAKQYESLHCGIFLVGEGRRSFYTHIVDGGGRVRFDPVCMRPIDPLARFASDWIAERASEAMPHFWSTTEESLLIDNHQTLHGRSNVPPSEERELKRIMIRWDNHAPL